MKEKIKLLLYGDGVTVTGFSNVLYNIVDNLPKEDFEISWLAINYYGDYPGEKYKDYRLYPASTKGNILGINRIVELIKFESPDVLFILNDIWVIDMILNEIKNAKLEKIPKIVLYFPVDSEFYDEAWFVHFDLVSEAYTYTQFGKQTLKATFPNFDFGVINHGVNLDTFYKIDADKLELKEILFSGMSEDVRKSWIVFNGNRNSSRKRIDITFEGFALFAKNKPDNVKLYYHGGLKDGGWNIGKLAYEYGIGKRLLITNKSQTIQQVPEEKLNLIYNACEVGINTSSGEGHGLVNHEHAITGAVQVVPNHTAFTELYHDCGVLIPVHKSFINPSTDTRHFLVTPEAVAACLEYLYENKGVYNDLSQKGINKLSAPEYQWKNIAKIWEQVFRRVLE